MRRLFVSACLARLAFAPAAFARSFTSITPLDENVEAIFRYLVSE